jgi:hypothetical protein
MSKTKCPQSKIQTKSLRSGQSNCPKGEPAGFVRVQVIPQPQYHEPLTLHFANGVGLIGIAENNMELAVALS